MIENLQPPFKPRTQIVQSDPSLLLIRVVVAFSGDRDAVQWSDGNVDLICSSEAGLVPAARRLVLGGAVSVVDGVAKGRVVVVAHLRVAGQNVLVLGTLWAGIATCSGPSGIVLGCPSGFVLICEEGLEPPINKEFRYVSSPVWDKGRRRV